MLRIRMARRGSTHRPYYRFVVNESARRPEAANIDEIGHYDPRAGAPSLKIDVEKAEAWIRKGAVPTQRFLSYLKKVKAGAR